MIGALQACQAKRAPHLHHLPAVIDDKPRYETEEIEESELTIIGRVVWGGGAKG